MTLTALDIQFIRSSFTTKTDAEIALVLEVDIDTVHEEINKLTGGGALDRSIAVQAYREALSLNEQEKVRKRRSVEERVEARRKKAAADLVKKEKALQERRLRVQQEENRLVEKRARESRAKFRTRDLQLDKLISVRIDHKTTLLVKPGTDIDKVKKLYTRTLEETIKSKNTDK